MKVPVTKGLVKDDTEGTKSKVALSSEEKRKLLEQYGCESDEEEYPVNYGRYRWWNPR
jgi:hypothetical protein